MNLGELIKGIAYLLESVGAPGQWERAAYIKEIARASAYATLKLGLTPAWVTTTNLQNLNTFTFATAPLGVLVVKESTMERLLLPSSEALEDGIDLSWRSKTGMPTTWWAESGSTLRLNRKATQALTLDVRVLETPLAMVNDADPVDPRFPAHVQAALRCGAAAYLLLQAGDAQDAKQAGILLAQFHAEMGVK